LETRPFITVPASATILLLAVDTNLDTRLGYALREAGYSVRLVSQLPRDLPDALRDIHVVFIPNLNSRLETESYCRKVKRSGASSLIIAVGPDDLPFKLRLFAMGIDDYVLDSCDALEFLARVKSLTRKRVSADGRYLQRTLE
jgi:DNA-binding response OmpR family regulator